MPIDLTTAFGLVALTRSLVTSSLRLLEERPQAMRGDMRRHWIAVENKWLAARYGLDGMYIRTPSGKRRSLRQEIADLINRMLPVARESGEQGFLLALQPLDSFESGAARQRRIYRDTGAWQPVLDDLKQRFADELKNAPAPS
jgi:carboxylate-amine ligase